MPQFLLRFVPAFLLLSGVGVLGATGCSKSPASIDVAPKSVKLLGETDSKRLSATVKDAEGNPLEGQAVTWSSADPAIASVDGDGQLKAAGSGKTKVTATVGEISGEASVEVGLLKAIKLEAAATAIRVGDNNPPLKLLMMNEKGDPLDGSGLALEWKSADPNVATVGPDGALKGLAPGATMITAMSGELRTDIAVTVLPKLEAEPAPPSPAPPAP